MEDKLINELFGTKRDFKRTLNNLDYAKHTLGLKGYAIWDFVTQPYSYLFDNNNYKEIVKKAFDKCSKELSWFKEFFL